MGIRKRKNRWIAQINDKKIKHLEDENARLKKEIELLKIQLEEQRKFYMS